jgi:hypothetical protein
MVSNIDRDDILYVAEELKIFLTEEQVSQVMHLYPHEEECDPTSTWELIVENCIYQVV